MATVICVSMYDFNPRSREGSDCCQHLQPLQRWTDFNPRSREGSDSIMYMQDIVRRDFNPRSREGSDKRNTQ